MYAEKACSLIKDLDRNQDALPPYNSDLVNEVGNEIKHLVQLNQEDARIMEEGQHLESTSLIPTLKIRHAAIKRNLRCLNAYHYNRLRSLRTMRWEFGSILPPDIKINLSSDEIEWFSKYSNCLVKYMRSLGENGLNLAVDLKPPKSLYVEVVCLTDYGRFELTDGTVLHLKKDTRHYLPRNECEELIRQGVFQHII